jgi:hypothetical protein
MLLQVYPKGFSNLRFYKIHVSTSAVLGMAFGGMSVWIVFQMLKLCPSFQKYEYTSV